MKKCVTCELPIRDGEEQPDCMPGIHYHRICFDINLANLTEELRAFARQPDSGYEELPNGKFRAKEPLQ